MRQEFACSKQFDEHRNDVKAHQSGIYDKRLMASMVMSSEGGAL